ILIWYREFILSAANNFHCGIGSIPFNFLGIPVSVNPRRLSTWSPVLEAFKKKLSLWHLKFLSFGGRVALLKSVMCSLPIYFLSFYKAPMSVISEIDKLQRRFLWGGGEGKRVVTFIENSQVSLFENTLYPIILSYKFMLRKNIIHSNSSYHIQPVMGLPKL
ncbi:hypothetical protein Lal_00024004, partial [Lupinus albus]